MHANLHFDLTDPEQVKEHLRCVHSLDMAMAIFQLQSNFRKKMEYYVDKYPESSDAMNYFLGELQDVLSEIPIEIDSIID